jgi:hypothetical protein
MPKQRVAQKIGNIQGARVPVGPAVIYSIPFCSVMLYYIIFWG